MGIDQYLLSTYSEPKHKLVTAELEIIHPKKEGIRKKMILIERDVNWGGEHTIRKRKNTVHFLLSRTSYSYYLVKHNIIESLLCVNKLI